MVRLDLGGGLRVPRRTLDHVRVERPLGQELERSALGSEPFGLGLECPDEDPPDDLPLGLGIGNPG